MADLGNQLEDASSGLERLMGGFDNFFIKMASQSEAEAKAFHQSMKMEKQRAKLEKAKLKERANNAGKKIKETYDDVEGQLSEKIDKLKDSVSN